jgi:hypothetical protein
MSKQPTMGEEPPNGDFVAYLEDIERRQMLAMSRAHRMPLVAPGTTGKRRSVQAPTPVPGEQSSAAGAAPSPLSLPVGASPATFVGALGLALIGLIFLLSGLTGETSTVLAIVGAVLLWQAWKRLRGIFDQTTPSQPVHPRRAG